MSLFSVLQGKTLDNEFFVSKSVQTLIFSFKSSQQKERGNKKETSQHETRANAGHAVLQSMLKPPKMRRRNGPTDGRTDGQTLL